MQLINSTNMLAGYTMGLKPDGRELIVVVIKGTFQIPEVGEKARLADEQVPLIEADVFSGEPGYSAPIYETDYAPFKAKCDVLFNGSAYVPGGELATEVPVALRVGSMSKSFNVVGNRVWMKGGMGIGPSRAVPFSVMPFSYDNAFGGFDNSHENPSKHKAVMANPVGVGFHSSMKVELVEGKPLPNTEEHKNPVKTPWSSYKPVALGPVGRGWEPRYKFAGTYDQDWIDNVFPFLPADFNDAYYQSAPQDQQIDYLKGGEIVVLNNLTPQGLTQFQIPEVKVPVVFFKKNEEEHQENAIADTLIIEPDKNRFSITWRASMPLKRNMFEVVQVAVGKMSKGWYRARVLGKDYHYSIKDFINSKNEA